MSKKREGRLIVDYSLDITDTDQPDEILDAIAEAHGFTGDGGGSGFGMRDLDYSWNGNEEPTREQIDALKADLEQQAPWLNSARFAWHVFDSQEAEDDGEMNLDESYTIDLIGAQPN